MSTIEPIRGNRLSLRLAKLADAPYIHALRVNPVYNQHLSVVTGTVEDQRKWLEAYQSREAKGQEYYFVIERLDGIPCGVVRLYNIGADSFDWGSWILDHNKPPKAALESALLSFGFGFERLGLAMASFETRRSNTHATAFYRRFGATDVGQDGMNIYFELSSERYLNGRDLQWSAIQRS